MGSARAARVFDTQDAAVEYAREKAKREGTELYVHGRDGTIRQRDRLPETILIRRATGLIGCRARPNVFPLTALLTTIICHCYAPSSFDDRMKLGFQLRIFLRVWTREGRDLGRSFL